MLLHPVQPLVGNLPHVDRAEQGPRQAPGPRRSDGLDGGAESEGRAGGGASQLLETARPFRIGQEHAPGSVIDRHKRVGGQAAGDRRQVIVLAGNRRQRPRRRPAGHLGSGGEVGGFDRWIAEEQRRELSPAAAAQVRDGCLRLGVAVHRVGGELVDVGEDRLRQHGQRLGLQVGTAAGGGDPPPRHPGADPVGGLERIEGTADPLLPLAQRHVDLAARLAAGVGVADQGDELKQCLVHPGADPLAKAPLQRARVLRHLAGDRLEDLLGDRRQLGLDQVGDRDRERPPGLGIEVIYHLSYKFIAQDS